MSKIKERIEQTALSFLLQGLTLQGFETLGEFSYKKL